MTTKFFTNENENTLLSKIEGVFAHRNIHFFDALVGYFRASGYFRIRKFIDKAAEIRILVGINIDKLLYKANEQGLLFDPNHEKAQDEFYNDLKKNIQDASYDKEVEEGMLQLISDLITKKLALRIHPKQNIHAKLYIFTEKEKHDHGYGSVITGSSNLTEAGLATNFEFNVELREDADIDFAKETFNNLWEESIPVEEQHIEKLQKETYLNDTFTPYEVYMKFLIEYFGTGIDYDPNSVSDLPKGFKKLSYQIDAVNDGYVKMNKHNGFFLADVVGLGKTIVAIMIAKKYYFTNGFPSYRSNTLIIVPPALKENWQETIDKFRLDNVEIITNGSLHKVKNPDKYDLIIVDEAHKFRSDTADMYKELQIICKSPTRNILPDGTKKGKKIILVSATPLNNKPEDIANLVYLFQDSKDSTLETGNLQHFFRSLIDSYKRLKDEPNIDFVKDGVKIIYDAIRNNVIEPLTVRRTRTDLNVHAQYKSDLDSQGIKFPAIRKPEKIFYQLDDQLDKLYDRSLVIISNPLQGLKYYRYQALMYLKGEKKSKYRNAKMISEQLSAIMKTSLVKRIDSSFYAFKQSLKRFKEATEAMLQMFENKRIYLAPNLPVNDKINEGKEEELIDLVSQCSADDPTIEVCTPDDFEDSFLIGLKQDYELLKEMCEAWFKVETDPKIDVFVDYLKNKLFNKKINHEQKLVVFSESKETTEYLYRELPKYMAFRILSVDSSNRKNLMQTVRENFDANYEAKKNDFDIVISTEVLAEGVNLHRSNIIVNYDTPWNSTRLMQRIGRVNRIGSVANEIHIFNFYPTAKVNSDIDLEKRAIMKLQAFHVALGEDSQIYSPDEETGTFGLFDKTVEEGKDERLVYLMKIRELKQNDPDKFKRLKKMPLRARVGRKSDDLASNTVCFIRNAKRDAFIKAENDNSLTEMSFLDAVKIFEAEESETGIKLHELHHQHVQAAIDLFADKIEAEKARDKKVDKTQGPNEKKALRYLDGMLRLPELDEEERQLIFYAKEAVVKGKFQNLQRDINKFEKNMKTAKLHFSIILENFLNILKKYPLTDMNEDTTDKVVEYTKQFKPEIIISESFSL